MIEKLLKSANPGLKYLRPASENYYLHRMVMHELNYVANGAYRYTFQGQEADNELWSGAVSYKYRVEDPRLGRFFSVDPLAAQYPHNSVYAFSENRVVDGIELEGLEMCNYRYQCDQVGDAALNIIEDVGLILLGCVLILESGGLGSSAGSATIAGAWSSAAGSVKLIADIGGHPKISEKVPETPLQLYSTAIDVINGNKNNEVRSTVKVTEDALNFFIRPLPIEYTECAEAVLDGVSLGRSLKEKLSPKVNPNSQNTENPIPYKQNPYEGRGKGMVVSAQWRSESIYTVMKGDTLSEIASRNNTTIKELSNLNSLKDPNKIEPGQVLKLK